MRLDARKFGMRSPNWINGGAPHANGFGTISTENKENLKTMVHHESLFPEIRIETCPIYYSCDTYIFLPISKQLAQNSLE